MGLDDDEDDEGDGNKMENARSDSIAYSCSTALFCLYFPVIQLGIVSVPSGR